MHKCPKAHQTTSMLCFVLSYYVAPRVWESSHFFKRFPYPALPFASPANCTWPCSDVSEIRTSAMRYLVRSHYPNFLNLHQIKTANHSHHRRKIAIQKSKPISAMPDLRHFWKTWPIRSGRNRIIVNVKGLDHSKSLMNGLSLGWLTIPKKRLFLILGGLRATASQLAFTWAANTRVTRGSGVDEEGQGHPGMSKDTNNFSPESFRKAAVLQQAICRQHKALEERPSGDGTLYCFRPTKSYWTCMRIMSKHIQQLPCCIPRCHTVAPGISAPFSILRCVLLRQQTAPGNAAKSRGFGLPQWHCWCNIITRIPNCTIGLSHKTLTK